MQSQAGAEVPSQRCRGSGFFPKLLLSESVWIFEGLLSGTFLLIGPVSLPGLICLNVNKLLFLFAALKSQSCKTTETVLSGAGRDGPKHVN